MHLNPFGGRAPSGPAGGDPLAGLRGWAPREGKENGRGEGKEGNLSPISTVDLGEG